MAVPGALGCRSPCGPGSALRGIKGTVTLAPGDRPGALASRHVTMALFRDLFHGSLLGRPVFNFFFARVPPPPQTKVTIVGQNEIYRWENLVGPFLVHKLLGPRPPPPTNTPLKHSPAGGSETGPATTPSSPPDPPPAPPPV